MPITLLHDTIGYTGVYAEFGMVSPEPQNWQARGSDAGERTKNRPSTMGKKLKTEFRTPIAVEIVNQGPTLAVGSIDHGPGHERAWVVIAKDGGAITVEKISDLRGNGVYVTRQPEAQVKA
jgi:hypothetical protein